MINIKILVSDCCILFVEVPVTFNFYSTNWCNFLPPWNFLLQSECAVNREDNTLNGMQPSVIKIWSETEEVMSLCRSQGLLVPKIQSSLASLLLVMYLQRIKHPHQPRLSWKGALVRGAWTCTFLPGMLWLCDQVVTCSLFKVWIALLLRPLIIKSNSWLTISLSYLIHWLKDKAAHIVVCLDAAANVSLFALWSVKTY